MTDNSDPTLLTQSTSDWNAYVVDEVTNHIGAGNLGDGKIGYTLLSTSSVSEQKGFGGDDTFISYGAGNHTFHIDTLRLRSVSVIVLMVILLVNVSPMSARAAEREHTFNPNTICDQGGAAEQFACLDERLRGREAQMNQLMTQAIDAYTNMWGDLAVAEGRKRLIDSQNAWKEYRDKHCQFGYYSKAPSHPASHDVRVTACKLDKTSTRIAEIKANYLQ